MSVFLFLSYFIGLLLECKKNALRTRRYEMRYKKYAEGLGYPPLDYVNVLYINYLHESICKSQMRPERIIVQIY